MLHLPYWILCIISSKMKRVGAIISSMENYANLSDPLKYTIVSKKIHSFLSFHFLILFLIEKKIHIKQNCKKRNCRYFRFRKET